MKTLGTGLALLSLSACAQAPTKELSIVEARVEAAGAVDAAVFAPELLAEAEAALARARLLAGEHGDYRGALRAAALASVRADEALNEASAARLVVVRQLDRALGEIAALLEMADARGGAEIAPVELSELRRRFEEIDAKADGELLMALEEATALKPELLAFEKRVRVSAP